MNKKIQIKKELKKLRTALILASTLATTPISANAEQNQQIELNVETIGKPEYANELYDILLSLDENLRNYLRDENVNIFLLEGENAAEEVWRQSGDQLTSSIRGFSENSTDPTGLIEDGAINVYIEASKHSGYYEKYSECSRGLTEDEFNYRLVRDTLLHELGHAIDGVTHFDLSGTEEFYQIYNEEVQNFTLTDEYNIENLKNNSNINSTWEYFATSFAAYMQHNDNLNLYCPKTYNYINNFIYNIKLMYTSKLNLTK